MKSIVELNTELDTLRSAAEAILSRGEAESRKLTDQEESEYRSILAKRDEIRNIIKEIEEKQNNIKLIPKKMEKKKFSLLNAVRSMVDGTPLDDVSAAVINAGKEQQRAAGLTSFGSIVIPTAENRATVSVTGSDGATVPVDVAPIFDELRAASVLEQAGATFYNGLVGDLKVPVMSAASVGWAGETAAASDAAANITSVKLSPKRLTAFLDISKQMLVQDAGSDVESRLMANLIRAINEKFEATVLGSAAGSATQPAGLFNGKTITDATNTWAGICNLEAAVERAKGKVGAIIASPESKAVFRALTYNKTTRLVYENGTMEDVPCLSTSNVEANKFVLGDFSYLVCGTWGGIDLTVDTVTQAANGSIRLVINVYMDAQLAKTGLLQFGKTA